MPVATTAQEAEKQIDAPFSGGLSNDFSIPPRPAVVQQVQAEMAKAEPDMRRMAHIIGQDVGLAVAVLKMANSPMYGLSRRAESVDQAVGLIGLKQLESLVTALAMRRLLKGDSNTLGRFYDTSSRRALAMGRMAHHTGLVDVAQAQSFGLFCDVGIPLLMHRFSSYVETLKSANQDMQRSFTAIEQEVHHTDHALVGALMTKAWHFPVNVSLAIRLHHDYAVFLDAKVPVEVARLISMNILAEEAIQRYAKIHSNAEWGKGGDYVASTLSMEHAEVQEWIDQLVELFDAN